MTDISPSIQREVSRRRTFAIISHPDAGKTTLTEKLLLFGGCIDIAGAVRGRKTQLEFDGYQVNLLDTPGHHDFSEDTYRTLMAADCAVMVIDLAKGVESQTEKLFRVCALRGIPVLTFVNKVDRFGQEPLEVLAEIEAKLGIEAVPQNWPLGTGLDFRGLVDMATQTVHLFDAKKGDRQIGYRSVPLAALEDSGIAATDLSRIRDEVELLAGAGAALDGERVLAGKMSPVFFGSALTNWGVEHFLRGFLALCPPPGTRQSDAGPIEAGRPEFAGFVFKIQANLDPRHRNRIAFVRVCSGRFRREMEVLHPRSGKKLRLRRAHRVFGQDRETMDEAFPGDIIGLVNPGEFHLGDTICDGAPLNFEPLPQFSPEFFAVLKCAIPVGERVQHADTDPMAALQAGPLGERRDGRAAGTSLAVHRQAGPRPVRSPCRTPAVRMGHRLSRTRESEVRVFPDAQSPPATGRRAAGKFRNSRPAGGRPLSTSLLRQSSQIEPLAEQRSFYYGWVMLPLSMATLIASSPGQTFGVSVFNEPLRCWVPEHSACSAATPSRFGSTGGWGWSRGFGNWAWRPRWRWFPCSIYGC